MNAGDILPVFPGTCAVGRQNPRGQDFRPETKYGDAAHEQRCPTGEPSAAGKCSDS